MYLDTRELYKRQCELAEELDSLKYDVECAQEALEDNEDPDEQEDLVDKLDNAVSDLDIWQAEYQEELDELNALEDEVGREWMHGETLIDEDEFTDYAEDLAADLHGDAVTDAAWPFSHIDWEAAADELKQDYSEVEYQGTTYLFRAN